MYWSAREKPDADSAVRFVAQLVQVTYKAGEGLGGRRGYLSMANKQLHKCRALWDSCDKVRRPRHNQHAVATTLQIRALSWLGGIWWEKRFWMVQNTLTKKMYEESNCEWCLYYIVVSIRTFILFRIVYYNKPTNINYEKPKRILSSIQWWVTSFHNTVGPNYPMCFCLISYK